MIPEKRFLNQIQQVLARLMQPLWLLDTEGTVLLPEENRGAIQGFIDAACVGGCALSAVIYGLLGEIFPLYLVFAAGSLISLPFALYLFCHRDTKEFVLTH